MLSPQNHAGSSPHAALPTDIDSPVDHLYRVDEFSLTDLMDCGAFIRALGRQPSKLQVAAALTRHLYTHVVDETGDRAFALVRLFETRRFDELDDARQRIARGTAPELSADTRCLTLVATAGDEEAWNDVQRSTGHQAIPLPSAEAIEQLPMVAQLVRQLGVEVSGVLRPDQEILVSGIDTGVFHVERAVGSPYIPAQEEFVKRYGIQSVVGFGDLLPDGSLFAVILFSRTPISRVTASLFGHLSLSTRMALLPHIDVEDRTTAQLHSLNRLLRNHERIVSRQERSLRDSEALYHSLVQSLPVCVLRKDLDGRFTFANRAYSEFTGHSLDAILGKTDHDLSPTAVAEKFRQDDLSVIENGIPIHEVEVNTTDEATRWVEVIKTAVHDAHGRTIGTQAIFWDVTERQQAVEALKEAKQAAEQANQAKSDFLANMSHEIRTPMNAIIGMAELLLTDNLTAVQRDYARTVLESSESLLTLINEILDFSKIEAGHLELEPVPFELKEEIIDMLRTLGPRAHRKNVELILQVDARVPRFVLGDPVRVRQVLLNLVGNSIKFTEQGEVAVTVDCGPHPEFSGRLYFAVRDTGIGISPDKLQQIFQAFTQADGSTTRRFGGTGLGLTISSRIVEAMGGSLSVESDIGHGSTFRFDIELLEAQSPEPEKQPLELTDLRDLPVLIVDDNATNRDVLRQIVESWGMKAETVASGGKAVEYLTEVVEQGGPLPLLLSDVNMPDMDGFMLVEQIRSSADLSDATMILLTSGGRPGDLERGKSLGVSAQLMKPVKASELLEAVMTAVGKQLPAVDLAAETSKLWPSPLPPLNILLAEDGKANQRLARALLERWGHTVAVADNGRVALALWQQHPFDLILMDVQMPELDGLEATRQIRELEDATGRRIPIIAITAHAMKGDRERCLEAGMDGYVAKPVRQHELYAAIAPFFEAPSAALPAESTTGGHPQLVNWDEAMRNAGGFEELLRDVTTDTLTETPELLRQLELALAEGRLADAGRLAHTIKSTGRTFGVERLTEQATHIEDLARAGQPDEATGALEEFRCTIESFERELRAKLQNLES